MNRRRYLLAVAGVGTLAGCSSDDEPQDTPTNGTATPAPTDTPTATEAPLEDAEIVLEGFRYPDAADGYEGEFPGVVLEDRFAVEVGVDIPVDADGEYDADLALEIEDVDGEEVTSASERVQSSTSSSDGSIQLFREFEFDAAKFDHEQYQLIATAEDFPTETEDTSRERVELLHPEWEARKEIREHMEDAKDVLVDAVDIYHDSGDGDWLDVTAATGAKGKMDRVDDRAFESEPSISDARETAIESDVDYKGKWDGRITRIEDERAVIRKFANKQIDFFDAYDEVDPAFESLAEYESGHVGAPNFEMDEDIESLEPWGDPVADYREKVEQMDEDSRELASFGTAASDTDRGNRRYELAEDYYDDGRYNDAESEAMDAIALYESALSELEYVEQFDDLRWSCRREVEPLLEAAEELRDDARSQQ